MIDDKKEAQDSACAERLFCTCSAGPQVARGVSNYRRAGRDVASRHRLSEEARAVPHGDGRRTQFQYDLAWVRTYLKWAGAAENSERGVWHLAPVGQAMSDDELQGIWKRTVAEQ